MDVILLSRIQFALTTVFHIIFQVLTIGLTPYFQLYSPGSGMDSDCRHGACLLQLPGVSRIIFEKVYK